MGGFVVKTEKTNDGDEPFRRVWGVAAASQRNSLEAAALRTQNQPEGFALLVLR